MAKLTGIESGVVHDVPNDTFYSAQQQAWLAGPLRFADETGEMYVLEGVIVPAVSCKIPPIEFKLLFTAPERVAIKTSTDPIVMDFFELVEQQREVNARDPDRGLIDLGMQSTRDAIDYLIAKGLVDPARRDAILLGALQ